MVSLRAEGTRSVRVKLTPLGTDPRQEKEAEPPEDETKKGSIVKYVIPAALVLPGTAAYFVFRDTNDPPVAALTIEVAGTPLAAVTAVRFDAGSSRDPVGDALTYSWNFGDGASAQGISVTHVYNAAGPFTVTLTASDGKESATATGSVTVRDLSGTWVGNLGGADVMTLALTQSGTSVSGTYSDTINGTGTVAGSVSVPRQIRMLTTIPGFRIGTWTGSLDSSLNTMTGSVDWFAGGVLAFTFRRR